MESDAKRPQAAATPAKRDGDLTPLRAANPAHTVIWRSMAKKYTITEAAKHLGISRVMQT